MSNNSGFGDINNCNSLNSSVVSSTTVNSIRRNSFYKLTNVLSLLFLVFGSCVVSFGMESENNELKEDGPVYIAPRDIYLRVPSIINKISMLFLTNVMGVNDNGMKDEVDNEKEWVYLLSLLGLHDLPVCYNTNNNNDKSDMLISYSIGTILVQPFYRGIFSVKPFSSKYDFIGCNWYLGIGNVSYVGGLFNLSLVCKPTFIFKYLHLPLNDKVTIHIIDIKPFNFILGCVFSTWLMWYTECNELYIRPQWIFGFCTVEINIAKYYNISLNVGSWIVDLITFMKYTKEDDKKELEKENEPQQ